MKFLPWELAHVFSNHLSELSGRSSDAPVPIWMTVLCVASSGGAMFYALSLFLGNGRTPYDRVSGTRVEAT